MNYKYDALGRRIEKMTITTEETQTTKYIYNGNQILLELGDNNEAITSYINGPGIDNVLAFTKPQDNQIYLTTRDHLNSVKEILNTNQEVIQSYKYSTYGVSTLEVAPGKTEVKNARTYTGREQDSECLYYYRARYYNPCIGRFISEDPIGFQSGDANHYRYVENNPIISRDPFGLQSYSNLNECRKDALDAYWTSQSGGTSQQQCDSQLKNRETICDLIDIYSDSGYLTEEEQRLDNALSDPLSPAPELP